MMQEYALHTSGILHRQLRQMQKHAYLNTIYNKNVKDIPKKLTLALKTRISDKRLSYISVPLDVLDYLFWVPMRSQYKEVEVHHGSAVAQET